MARSLLVHAALAASALSLRAVERGEFQAVETEELQRVPAIREFSRVWKKRYVGEYHLQDPMPSSIQLVLGVFTVAPDSAYREIVRQTWLRQTGVCYWQRQPKTSCSVYVAFVVGNNGTGGADMSAEEVEKTHGEKGMLVLDTPENMNLGKSRVWFDTARQLFPWATHVGKTDMDTYPFLHKLVHRMEAGRACSLKQSAYEVIGRPHDAWGPRFEHVCGGDGCPQFVSELDFVGRPVARLGAPWRFLSGEFYVLSMPLVQRVDWTIRFFYTEDAQVTQAVDKAAKDNGFCVVLRRLDSWFHNTSEVNANYANDLVG